MGNGSVKFFEFNSIVPIVACFNGARKNCVVLYYDGDAKELWVMKPNEFWRILKNMSRERAFEFAKELAEKDPEIEVYFVDSSVKCTLIYYAESEW